MVIALVALAATSLAHGLILSDRALGWRALTQPTGVWLPAFVAMLAAVAMLAYPVSRSALRGARLLGATFSAVFGINVFLTAVEGVVFLNKSAGMVLAGATFVTFRAAVLAILVVLAFGGEPKGQVVTLPPSPKGTRAWLVRITLCSLSYLVLYLTAGALIFPYIASFYETQEISVGLGIIPLQLVRGFLYVVFCLPLLRSMVGRRWQVALGTALLFPVLAGAVNLLIPNPLMPDWVRPFHTLEIAGSNFVYGYLVGLLFWNPNAGFFREEEQTSADPLADGLAA